MAQTLVMELELLAMEVSVVMGITIMKKITIQITIVQCRRR